MPVPEELNTFKKTYEMIEVFIVDICQNTDKDAIDERNGDEFRYDLKFTFKDVNGEFKERSNTTSTTKDWSKKFYLNRDGFQTFTSGHAKLALVKILGEHENGVNGWIGKAFRAVVVQSTDYHFIDWTKTLEANGVEMPILPQVEIKGTPDQPEDDAIDKIIDQMDNDTQEEAKGANIPNADDVAVKRFSRPGAIKKPIDNLDDEMPF